MVHHVNVNSGILSASLSRFHHLGVFEDYEHMQNWRSKVEEREHNERERNECDREHERRLEEMRREEKERKGAESKRGESDEECE